MLDVLLGKLGNVHKTVLMDTDIYESAEINDVSDGSLLDHSRL